MTVLRGGSHLHQWLSRPLGKSHSCSHPSFPDLQVWGGPKCRDRRERTKVNCLRWLGSLTKLQAEGLGAEPPEVSTSSSWTGLVNPGPTGRGNAPTTPRSLIKLVAQHSKKVSTSQGGLFLNFVLMRNAHGVANSMVSPHALTQGRSTQMRTLATLTSPSRCPNLGTATSSHFQPPGPLSWLLTPQIHFASWGVR